MADGANGAVGSLVVAFIANDTVNDAKAQEVAEQLAEMVGAEAKLLDIVLGLKGSITSEDSGTRRKALNCLSSVLACLDSDKLPRNEIEVMCQFYNSKLDDELLALETLSGFRSLCRMVCVTGQQVSALMKWLTDEYVPSRYLAAVRFVPFQILDGIYHNKFKDGQIVNGKLTEQFVQAYINVASGEKDPRNLLLSFQLNERISTSLPAANSHRQELFDILFSYFPITFRPPKNDPYKIANVDLKLALRSALSAAPMFAQDAFGNLVDKLSASSPTVKQDTLLTLKRCIENFGGQACADDWLPIWKALKFEVMHSVDDNDDSLALAKVTPPNAQKEDESTINNYQTALDVIRTLSRVLQQFNDKVFDTFFTHALEDLKPNFDLGKSLKQSCAIFSAIGSSNKATFDKTIESVLPLFLVNTTEVPKLKLLLMNLSFFLGSYIQVFGETQADQHAVEVPDNKLASYKDEILMILGMALTGNSKIEVTVRTLSVIQFTKLIKMKGYLTDEEIALIVQYLTETILTDNNKNIYFACLEGLKVISEFYEQLVYSVSLKQMLDLLPNSFNGLPEFHNGEYITIETILKIILDFTTSRHILVKESIVALCSKLLDVVVRDAARSSDYCFLLLSTLLSLYDNNIVLMTPETLVSIKKLVEPVLFQILEMKDDKSVIGDDYNFPLFSTLFYFINLKGVDDTQLQRYTDVLIKEYKILEKYPCRYIMPYVKILSALDKTCVFEQSGEVFHRTVELLRADGNIPQVEKVGYLEFLMVLTNKWLSDDEIEREMDLELHSDINLKILTWVGKGLVMRSSKLGPKILKQFIELLSDKQSGALVSKLFEVFVIDINTMKRYKGCGTANNVKALYKQKFFSDIFKTLVALYRSNADMDIKCNCLTALSMVLKHTPSQLIEPFMNDLLPMLLQALEMPNSEVRVSSLETLSDVTEKFHQLITEHTSTLIPLLLKLVVPGTHNNAAVRLMSLKLLEVIAAVVPLNYCLEFKEQVIVGLLKPLSDKKRIIRKQSIDTRQVYFELGQVPFE
ncbi:Met18p KNAG_0M01910 [Huiozyma naganishii CBS 8797]|uniref:MMS19 nucleotide excision repair protein n=1 Tax=Huiozyma naganishii (strain ATCC MYA-139 / BCRC 22969 / CBS 8797 / KCTC 17520 / NBRC 10181 / NCYC 3082 / Yp74L-3) TaxID=1071383 RepID=J7SAU1_HUIN7|nr:hypothetical protein KNAG_0M01910 [Kazachstania naganishii CBS 8797]CCK73044.1 hypothetical protein KNAG_0M01910 [Kazachstania naganishii CBS 8797]